ncbi:histone H1 [Culex quinquefasciatus]|uniref:Histone H1 n=2 Tax=Culex pipiens complex TaxID=518105 RepID=B0WTD9_CULQU|nr:histone H1, orphon-like [Culex pipiens pallens]EDS34377.1 histone H1 [Culex quinquefasciatus]|eukprot:XP_001870859.1 histone H1 [Culex quinquefasciatus]
MAATSETAEDRSSPEPETIEEDEQESPSPAKAKGRGRPKKEKAPKAPKQPKVKVPRGPGRPKGKSKPVGRDNPPIADMIIEAMETLEDRKGITLQAIKRFMDEAYGVDPQRLSVRIKKAILAKVDSGDIIRVQANGGQGRFRLKPFKVAVVTKRAAPENYVQLPYGKSSPAKPAGKIGKFKKAIADAKPADDATGTPTKGKRGRPKKT